MSGNKSEDEHYNTRPTDIVDSPRKRIRLDNCARKSWSLIDKRADHEVLLEMGVSLLEPDDGETEHHAPVSRPPLKRKHNIENLNPNITYSPKKISPKKHSPVAGPSKLRSPRSTEKCKPLGESELNSTITTDYQIDEETPLAQMTTHLPTPKQHKRQQSVTPLGAEEERILLRPKWEPSGSDSFRALSDEVMMSVFKWLPKRTLAHCMLVCKRWYRVACDETLWQRLDLGNKTISKDALGRILERKPVIVRLASSELGPWQPPTLPPPSRVHFLDLSMCAADKATLDNLLTCCPHLRKLSLENVVVNNNTCEIIGKCTNLETLNLTMAQGITADGLTHILKGCTSLQALNISWCNLDEKSLQILVSTLPQNLMRLNIAGARLLTDDMVKTLSVRCPRLKELDISDCARLTGVSTTAIQLLQLEHLALSRCYLMPASALAKLNSITSLQYLDVFGMLQQSSLSALRATMPTVHINQFMFSALRATMPTVHINQFMFSAIARPTVGPRRTSLWGQRTRD